MTARVIHVNDARPDPLSRAARDRIRSAALAALASGPIAGPDPEEAEVSVTLVDSDRMRELNASYHGADEATDVLAFDLGADAALLGDIYVCVDIAARAAAEQGETLEDELARLAIHGTLHLLGHDHPEGADRWDSEMYRLQERLLETV